jgi:hypothetical protein
MALTVEVELLALNTSKQTALDRGARLAEAASIDKRVDEQRHDLAHTPRRPCSAVAEQAVEL